MLRSQARRPAAAWLASWFLAASAVPAVAQTRAVAPIEGLSAPASPPIAAPVGGMGNASPMSLGILSGSGLTVAPSATAPSRAALLVAPAASLPAAGFVPARAEKAAALASASIAAFALAPAPGLAPALRSLPAASIVSSRGEADGSGAEAARQAPADAPSLGAPPVAANAREAAALETIESGAASWGPAPRSEDLAAAADGPAPAASPARARPGLARGVFAVGAALVGTAIAAAVVPAVLPAALVGVKGAIVYAGFGLLAVSRFWRAPTAAPAADVAAPANEATAHGRFASFRAAWAAADGAARGQVRLEARVGASSRLGFRDWFLGGLRTALFWLPVTLGGMLAGAAAGRGIAAIVGFKAAAAAAPVGLMKMSLGALALGPLATSLIHDALSLVVFDSARAALTRLGAGRAAAPLAGVVAVALAGAMLLALTHSPFVIAASLAVNAAMLWLRARSSSWLAPLALGGIFTTLSLDSARMGVWLKFGAAGTLATLPVWTGAVVALLLLGALVWSAGGVRPKALWLKLKEHVGAVSDFGSWWRTPSEGGAPKSPLRLLRLAGLWGLVTYALGDLTYLTTNAIASGSEPAPAILARLLTSPVDLVLYNFLFVGFFEEFVFRRGLFASLRDWLGKRGLTAGRAFWTAATLSALIFSGAHYIDYGALLGRLGLGSALASSGLGGSYSFSWAGFVSRGALGVLMAWLYQRSGLLALPALAHAAADTLEGLGLRWGLAPFLALATLVLYAQKAGAKVGAKVRAAGPPASRAYKAFTNAAVYGGLAAALAPVLWGAAPALKSFFLLGVMAFTVLPALAVVHLARGLVLRRGAAPKPSTRRRRLAAAMLGLALGGACGIAPQLATGPITQAIYAFSDAANGAHSQVRSVPGYVMADETVRVLSANPVGRSVVDRLRDRGGVVRMPHFFLRSGDDGASEIVADHEGFTDGVYIGDGVLKTHGWNADEFLRRPDWQRQAVDELQVTLAHELTHADQSRRSPFERETWEMESMEHEYEAYTTQSLYVHAMLKADPHARIDMDSLSEYTDELERGLLPVLADHDADYPKNHHIDGPRWREFRDAALARWPAIRVEGFMLLSERNAKYPFMSAGYVKKARAAAAAAGLPVPAPGQIAAKAATPPQS